MGKMVYFGQNKNIGRTPDVLQGKISLEFDLTQLWFFFFFFYTPSTKLLVRKIRSRLALIYRALGDEEQYNTHSRLASQTDAALGLTCGACGEVFGLEADSLEALPCAHILHAR